MLLYLLLAMGTGGEDIQFEGFKTYEIFVEALVRNLLQHSNIVMVRGKGEGWDLVV